MKEIIRKDGSRYFIVNVLGKQNIFEIAEDTNEIDAKQTFSKIESNDENILRSIARMHSSKLLITIDGISLVNGSQNLHEAVRIYEHLLKSENQDIVKTSHEALKLIKQKHASLLSNKYYYLKIGDNFVYTDRGKIYQMRIKDYHDYIQFNRTLKGLEKNSKKSQYNMGIRLSNIDKEEAIEYYKKSAEQGYAYAQYNLGCIMKKRGNIEEAQRWFELAQKQKNEEKTEKKQQFQKEMKSKNSAEDNIKIENEK